MAPLPAAERKKRASIAARARHNPNDPALIDERRSRRAAALEAHVRRVVDVAPPLTQAQRDRVAAALGRGPDVAADSVR